MTFLRSMTLGITLVLLLSLGPTVVLAGSRSAGTYPARQAPWEAIRSVACFELAGVMSCAKNPGADVSCQKWAQCPVTSRLGHRYLKVSGGPGVHGCDCQPIVRAQFAPAGVTVAGTTRNNSRARAEVTYDMGKSYGPSHETFVALKDSRGWQVANIYCTGKPKTTIYHNPLNPCYTATSSIAKN